MRLRIAAAIKESGVKFRWTFQASTDFLCRMSEDEVRLLGDSGVSHMGFGTESTSEDVLKLMNKRHQRVDEMFETARKANIAGIRVTFNLIFGYPGETEADRAITFRTMSEIARQFRNVSFSPNIFTPYPGIPIWPQLRELGVHEPQSLREWMEMPLGANVLPWLQGKGTGAAAAHARVLPAEQPDSPLPKQEFPVTTSRSAAHRGGAHTLAIASQPLFVSVGAVVGTLDGAPCVAAVVGYRAGASEGAGERMLKRLSSGGDTVTDVLLTHSYHLPYDRKQVRKMQPYLPLGTLYAASVLRAQNISAGCIRHHAAGPDRWISRLRLRNTRPGSSRFMRTISTFSPRCV